MSVFILYYLILRTNEIQSGDLKVIYSSLNIFNFKNNIFLLLVDISEGFINYYCDKNNGYLDKSLYSFDVFS